MKISSGLCLAFLTSFAALSSASAQQRVEVSRDLWVSSYPTEVEGNNGASPRLKLKGIQEFFLVDLDPETLKGKKVLKAWLHVRLISKDHPLQRTSVSSVTQEWTEGTGSSYQKVAGASSFAWARTGELRWGRNEPDLTAVINGEGGSVWGFGDVTAPDAAGWQVIPVAPNVVQARIDGRSHGFAVMDDVGSEYQREGNSLTLSPNVNRYVSSREDRKDSRPYFTLLLEEGTQQSEKAAQPVAAVPVVPVKLPPLLKEENAADSELPVRCRDAYGEPLKALRFEAAKGETVGFILESRPAEVQVELPGVEVRLYALPKAGGVQDPLVPAGSDVGATGVDLTTADTYVEMRVPKSAKAGVCSGEIKVSGRPAPLRLMVWNFTLPDRLSFLPQMNAYGLPGQVRDYYRLTHEHRTTLNQLPYGWTGRLDEPKPEIRKDGTWDWKAYDEAFGPLLDGSAFAGLPRAGTPVEAWYLMLNENWPMNHEAHFRGGYWIENAFDAAYWDEFRHASAEVARHFEEKGWTEPMIEFFLNNKVYFKKDDWRKCSAAWVFDEPVQTQDFWALRRYGMEFWKAVEPWSKVHLCYRADISRPQWQRDLLDDCVNVEVVSGALRTWWPRVLRRAQQHGNLYYMYGSASPAGAATWANAAWCVESWSLGADGVVPWNTIGDTASWQKPTETSVLYPAAQGPVPSLRLKSFLAGQQLVEYLTQYTAVSGHSRAEVMAAVRELPGLSAVLVKRSEADAGRSQFGAETHEALKSLRLRLGSWLNAQAPAPRERWHDPRPARPDFKAARKIEPLRAE
ncbi:hypothetical protein [Prosthecobacter sp.]|uniref:hypothetical protein n=1 Tax=Prosthecobacter sp. TaxID=1965333 RepID=UPI0037853020